MRKLLFVPLIFVAGNIVYMVWSSSPTVPLTLTRQQAIARAATDATVSGKLAWIQVESKLVTYAEWSRILPLTPSFAYVDTTDRDALVWVVAYFGPMDPTKGPNCEWAIRAFRADGRIATDWSASLCGGGELPSAFETVPDRSWFRLDDLRGD